MATLATPTKKTAEKEQRGRSYMAISEVTGLPVIVSPPNTPVLTSERVRKLLEDFP